MAFELYNGPGQNAIPPPAMTEESRLPPPLPTILTAPIALKIHDLDDSTARSAEIQARSILAQMNGKLLTVPGFLEPVKVELGFLDVFPGNPTAGDRRNHSATIRYKPHLYRSEADMPDERFLASLGEAIRLDLNIPCRWSASANNDRSTVLSFEWSKSNDIAGMPLSEDTITIGLAELAATYEFKITSIWEIIISEDGLSAQGCMGITNPEHADRLINATPIRFTDVRGIVPMETDQTVATEVNEAPSPTFNICFYRHDLFIPVTLCTTLALHSAGAIESDATFEADAKKIMATIAPEFPGEEVSASGFRRSPCGKWFLFDASRPRHALRAVAIPACNGGFYESAYIINSNLANFRPQAIQKSKLAKRAAYDQARRKESDDNSGRPTKRQRQGRATFRDRVKKIATTNSPSFRFDKAAALSARTGQSNRVTPASTTNQQPAAGPAQPPAQENPAISQSSANQQQPSSQQQSPQRPPGDLVLQPSRQESLQERRSSARTSPSGSRASPQANTNMPSRPTPSPSGARDQNGMDLDEDLVDPLRPRTRHSTSVRFPSQARRERVPNEPQMGRRNDPRDPSGRKSSEHLFRQRCLP